MEYTFLDKTIDLFFQTLGGLEFLGLFFGSLIIIIIIMSLLKPFEV